MDSLQWLDIKGLSQTHPALFLFVTDGLTQLKIGGYMHVLVHRQQRLQAIVLRDVAGHAAERGCRRIRLINKIENGLKFIDILTQITSSTIEQDGAIHSGCFETGKGIQQSGLSCSRRSHNGDELAAGKLSAYIVQDFLGS